MNDEHDNAKDDAEVAAMAAEPEAQAERDAEINEEVAEKASRLVGKVKPKKRSRPQRWAAACSDISEGIEQALAALEELKEVREEYQEWYDNLPENLQATAVGEKLSELLDSVDPDDIEASLEAAQGKVGEADGIDLPRGFGKD